MMKIGTQLHLGGDTPLLEAVRPVKNSSEAAFVKKFQSLVQVLGSLLLSLNSGYSMLRPAI